VETHVEGDDVVEDRAHERETGAERRDHLVLRVERALGAQVLECEETAVERHSDLVEADPSATKRRARPHMYEVSLRFESAASRSAICARSVVETCSSSCFGSRVGG